jgi:hypothetical protein
MTDKMHSFLPTLKRDHTREGAEHIKTIRYGSLLSDQRPERRAAT